MYGEYRRAYLDKFAHKLRWGLQGAGGLGAGAHAGGQAGGAAGSGTPVSAQRCPPLAPRDGGGGAPLTRRGPQRREGACMQARATPTVSRAETCAPARSEWSNSAASPSRRAGAAGRTSLSFSTLALSWSNFSRSAAICSFRFSFICGAPVSGGRGGTRGCAAHLEGVNPLQLAVLLRSLLPPGGRPLVGLRPLALPRDVSAPLSAHAANGGRRTTSVHPSSSVAPRCASRIAASRACPSSKERIAASMLSCSSSKSGRSAAYSLRHFSIPTSPTAGAASRRGTLRAR